MVIILGRGQEGVSFYDGVVIVVPYFISLLLYLNFAYLLSSWLKKSGFVLGIILLYSLIIENLITWKLPDSIDRFFPMNLVSRMKPNPLEELIGKESTGFSALDTVLCFAYIALFVFTNYWMLKMQCSKAIIKVEKGLNIKPLHYRYQLHLG